MRKYTNKKIKNRIPRTLKLKARGGYLLGTVLLIFVALSVLMGVLLSIIDQATKFETPFYASYTRAFYVAQAGIETAFGELQFNRNWNTGMGQSLCPDPNPLGTTPGSLCSNVIIPGQNGGADTITGQFQVDLRDGPLVGGMDSIWIRSIGVEAQENTSVTLFAQIRVSDAASYAIATMGDLSINAGASLNASLFGRDIGFFLGGNTMNNVDVNFFYQRNLLGDFNNINFDPNFGFQKVTSAVFPTLYLPKYRNVAQDIGNIYGTGLHTINLATIDPAINYIYIEGDACVSGNYDHSVLIVAEGNINICGSIAPNSTDVNPDMQLGLFSNNDIIIDQSASGSLSVDAFLFASGQGDANRGGVLYAQDGAGGTGANFDFHGTILAKGEASGSAIQLSNHFTGNRTYTHRRPNTDPFGGDLMPSIADFYQITYDSTQALDNNGQIIAWPDSAINLPPPPEPIP